MKRLRPFVLAASTFGALAALLAGCGTNPAPTSVVCTDFRAGSDLSGSTFGVTGELQQPYEAFAQAAGDLAAVANEMLRNVGASCEGLALELGADRTDPRFAGKVERDAIRVWCTLAAERFAIVRPDLVLASFTVVVATPKCTIDTDFQSACETRCATTPSCTEASTEERCPVDARQGVCSGSCAGTCTGSETAAAACAGSCSGTCFGTCGASATSPNNASTGSDSMVPHPGKDTSNGSNGNGNGASSAAKATDCSTGCTCTQVCTGACTAACDLPAPGAHCDALCAGSCSVPMIAPTCSAPLAPPKCPGNVDCQKSCSASSAARAVCPDGSLSVVVNASARRDPKLARIVGALERHLPAIFLAERGRAQTLSNGASDLLDSAGHILSRADELGPMGAACGMLIGETSEEARKNLSAALAGSRDLARAVTNDPAAAVPVTPGPN